ncbi:hypothetical protein DNH61_05985 [Paenibacillus sambharensis]|uniref:Uncharacterized protein n=1 Tax=Paenibacillus sambharensis TaxID=1803190 RepID=A0A2W1LPF8_9BACL|nr:hypothetical protein [Paenibacillus sambharensis]PZD96745.1 hypothetical protein DNH61_05985 [Paenibacillus sambharensis]
MNRKRRIYALAVIGLLIIAALILLPDASTPEEKIEQAISSRDDSFVKLIHVETNEPYTYAFYRNQKQSAGLALLHVKNDDEIHVFGSIPTHQSSNGFSYGTGESQQLDQYVMYGLITNPQISRVDVSGEKAALVPGELDTLWYYISSQPFTSAEITAENQSGQVIFQKQLYK